ncbi:TRAP transporter small permease subunit [Sneathiella sp. HT1-7]|uniref:TRAP transporter small permease subunit n=1 Tax=Sneathiella sp. HT1-7 TaxID=2887192 RepID=UPI001D1425C1|nr:TRAP transporter small permease [Sneathiella sp. HT1-7]MCC3306201.1 TRAP transporter small permease [Sneathiella sp. HT1-7]
MSILTKSRKVTRSRSALTRLDVLIRYLVDVCLALSCCLALFLAIFGSADVLTTFLFNKPIPLARELSEVLLPVIIFAAMSAAMRENRHVNVDLFISNAGPFVRRLIQILTYSLGSIVFFILAWQSAILAADSFADKELAAAAIRFPVWPIKIAVTAAMTIIFLECIRKLAWSVFANQSSETLGVGE